MRYLFLGLLTLVTACGFASKGNTLTGQVKKVGHITPLICPDRDVVDISLGVMRNGVGSMSHEDVWLQVEGKSELDLLERAAKSGLIVDVTYDVWRLTICSEDHVLRTVSLAP